MDPSKKEGEGLGAHQRKRKRKTQVVGKETRREGLAGRLSEGKVKLPV